MTPPEPETATVPRLIDAGTVAALLAISTRHLARLVHDGEFPRPIRVGGCSRWEAGDYAKYVAQRRAASSKRARNV